MNNKQKKILIISSSYPLRTSDAQVPWLKTLVDKLSDRTATVDVLAPAYLGSKSHTIDRRRVYRFRYAPSVLEMLTQNEGAIVKIRTRPVLSLLVVPYLISGSIYLGNLLLRRNYDVVNIHWPFPHGLFSYVIRLLSPKSRIVYTFHGAEFTLMQKVPFGKSIARLLLSNADAVIANSTFTKGLVQNINKVSVSVIPFAAVEFLSAKKTGLKKKNHSKTIRLLYVGRLIERKGVPYLLEAVSELLKNHAVRLDIIGDGSSRRDLEKSILRMGLDSIVYLHGRVGNRKLTTLYKTCDIFVLPSIRDAWGDTEGLGVVLLEAMSFGKPVVATRVGGVSDIVRHGKNGFLVAEKDSTALSDAIEKLIVDQRRRRRMGAFGKRYVREHFNWERVVARTQSAFLIG